MALVEGEFTVGARVKRKDDGRLGTIVSGPGVLAGCFTVGSKLVGGKTLYTWAAVWTWDALIPLTTAASLAL